MSMRPGGWGPRPSSSVRPGTAGDHGVPRHALNHLWSDQCQIGRNTLARSNNALAYTLGPSGQGGGNPGNTVADRDTGVVYVTANIGGGAYVGFSADGGATLHKTNITGGTDGGCSGSTGTDFSVIAIDTQGDLYLVYACQNGTNPWRVYFSHTTGFTSVNVT